MDLRKLKTLIDLVSESNISELEITEADGKVRIVKADPHGTGGASHAASPMSLPPAGDYAVAMCFLPHDAESREAAIARLYEQVRDGDKVVVHW